MGSFIHGDFLLENRTAHRLHERYAGAQPIIDYHCHISAKNIAENRRFRDLFEIWLEGDHYKWRAMRANGLDEQAVREVSRLDKDSALLPAQSALPLDSSAAASTV